MLKYAYSCTKALLISTQNDVLGSECEKLTLFRVLAGVLFPMREF